MTAGTDQKTISKDPILPKIIAFILAMGGIFWGILITPLFFGEKFIYVALIFAPGYLATFGCLIRAFFKIPLPYRQAIWGISLLVQGSWLVWHLHGTLNSQMGISGFFNPPLVAGWWLSATLASIIGLILEK